MVIHMLHEDVPEDTDGKMDGWMMKDEWADGKHRPVDGWMGL